MPDALADRVIAWRRHLHAHPELSFAEHETSRWLAGELRALGLAPTHPTPTSVVADVRGGRPGRLVAVRADIDALPIDEQTGLPFASRTPGVMHACGHDGHSAALLGVAALLAEQRAELAGGVRLVFQHGEERPPHGARDLIAAGVLDGVDAIVGQHLWASLPLGTAGMARGPLLGSTDYFLITLRGAGGHAGLPHLARSPVDAAADLVPGLHRIVAREVDPVTSLAVSVTTLEAGTQRNVIPELARVGGTVRALDEATRTFALERVQALAHHVAALHRLEAEVELTRGVPVLVNDPAVGAVLAQAAGEEAELREIRPFLAGEDFAFYLREVPGAFVLVGAGRPPDAGPHPHHHPRFVLEEDAILTGMRILHRAALALLAG